MGELDFVACYQKRQGKNRKYTWEIISCPLDENCIHDYYEIKILLDSSVKNGWPKVFETGGRIEKLASQTGQKVIDLHLYPNDKSCCLGICVNPNITLTAFIYNIVYPYFVWQAYYHKYKKVPPCGQYSHGRKGIEECLQQLETIGRNDKCICNSGKKYKYCCIHNETAIKSRLRCELTHTAPMSRVKAQYNMLGKNKIDEHKILLNTQNKSA